MTSAKMRAGNSLADLLVQDGRREPAREERIVRVPVLALVVVALLLAGFGIGRASDRDEAAVTVKVSSADHEAEEGYFSLGDSATLMVRPGSELYQFLTRQRGRKIKVVMSEAGTELSKLERNPER